MHDTPIPKWKRSACAALAVMRDDPCDPRHGTAKGYNYGCRCERCRAAKHERYETRYEAARRARWEREKRLRQRVGVTKVVSE